MDVLRLLEPKVRKMKNDFKVLEKRRVNTHDYVFGDIFNYFLVCILGVLIFVVVLAVNGTNNEGVIVNFLYWFVECVGVIAGLGLLVEFLVWWLQSKVVYVEVKK